MMNKVVRASVAALVMTWGVAMAGTAVKVLPSGAASKAWLSPGDIVSLVKSKIDVEQFREVRVQVIDGKEGRADHLLVHLFMKGFHRVDFAMIPLKANKSVDAPIMNYALQSEDHAQQPDAGLTAVCPDDAVQFVSLCPNDDKFEIGIAQRVADAAKAHKLKTVMLLPKDATRKNWMNYMACPNLVGNFYDGDSNPDEIVTSDGVILASEIKTLLKQKFRHSVTNIWLACEAYNDPMLVAVRDTAQSQKYAAGKNNLLVGPSDETAACTMEGALDGKVMSTEFKRCYDEHDDPQDEWGFGGDGKDIFGTH